MGSGGALLANGSVTPGIAGIRGGSEICGRARTQEMEAVRQASDCFILRPRF
jgi:hypothetical protein